MTLLTRALTGPLTWWRSTKTPARVAFRRPWPSSLRGLLLAELSIAVIFIGAVNYVATALPPTNRTSLAFALSLAPSPVWGWIMIAAGVFALWTSYCHLGRDRAGFTVLAFFCICWGAGYLCSVLFFDASARALGSSVIWWIFATVLVTAAAFPNVAASRSDRVYPPCEAGQAHHHGQEPQG